MEVNINGEKFYQRLQRFIDAWIADKSTAWGGADALCIPHGGRSDDNTNYSKSAALQIFLLGYEIPDSIIVITRNGFWFMATEKKCKLLENALANGSQSITFHALIRSKDEGMNREHFNSLLGVIRRGGGSSVGSLFKQEYKGDFIASWLQSVDASQLNKVDIAAPVGLFLSIKDVDELDCCKKAAILSNKVMKHGFVAKMENILENELQVKHEDLSSEVEGIIFNLDQIGVKITAEAVNSCFAPIIQSGGKYDIRVSAQSNADPISPDIIICSLGAKYKEYCANVSRTFLVDAPPKIEETYAILMALYDHCLEKMVVGGEMKDVYAAAKAYLTSKDATLLTYLPKTLGFAMGLQFRDSSMLLNDKNTTKFAEGMVFNIAVGFHNVPLSAEDKKGANGAIAKLNEFSLLIADTVVVVANGPTEVLTKISRDLGSVSYSVAGKDEGDEDGEEEDEDMDANQEGVRRSSRRSAAEVSAMEAASQERSRRQYELMQKKISEARQRLKSGGSSSAAVEESAVAVDLKTYASPDEYPRDTNPTQVKVDLDREALILPINGQPVPFHISTIKNITRPEEGQATEIRVNFYIPGSAASKDVPKNMQQLLMKYGDKYAFVKEMTFKASNSKHLSNVYQQFQELRKRVKQREQRAEQEKDLVVQQKLIKIKDQRVPRLQDLSMRPTMSGRKSIGTIEIHQNGLRFTSTKNEIIDIMFANIKHAIYQPCDNTSVVLIHFHLKDFILIGKKKQKDIQFYTEVVEASLNLEASKRSNYDPDELEEEQQERELRKRVNIAFKEFCLKIEKISEHYGNKIQVDVPFKKSGFQGNCNKEMVFLQPTTHCLANLTEMPPFVLTLSEIEHCHFERVNYATKNFDLVFIFKNYSIPPKIITAIDMKDLEKIQDWLSLNEITYTLGPKTMSWEGVMEIVRDQGDNFFMDVDENGDKKPVGWLFLSAEDSDDEEGEEEEDEDSSYASDEDSEEESEEESDEDSDDEYVDSDEEEDDEDDEDDEEEEGKSWEELEREAGEADRKRALEDRDRDRDESRAKKVQKTSSSSFNPSKPSSSSHARGAPPGRSSAPAGRSNAGRR